MALKNDSNLAVLIDGDNISPTYIDGLMAEIVDYGTASVRRIYGDWTTPDMKNWKPCLLKHSITPMQTFAYTSGKNSTDGAMIIDAMDLLYTGRFAGFCIVSSDSDFIRLASRIREQGVTVYGFGERKTSQFFVAACNKFTYFDVLKVEPQETVAIPTGPKAGQQILAFRPQQNRRPFDKAALNKLAIAITNTSSDGENWANLAQVGDYLSRMSPDVNARNYGYEKLRDFVQASGIVELRWKDMGNNPPVALVRRK